ncbi:apolipoprotein N-acyltransferase [Aidingimonas halophila]|uniref:Apolipoprotein N-acyltransferase n=1 Tax=Aidingimonas halophila TaxID=574349 RepID=A0A1H3H4Q9_9GAMM|nr:apolipoprotein N-acyltransferase [Aidingimonas halophila]GHC36773.1 apolipoprotein N-acyltransferase [Aidingimonas halophila]SDY10195.1 Apolipoprotein N-acyltransferase [Aidingimonas halophila]
MTSRTSDWSHSPAINYLIALLSGGLMTLATAPFSLWWLSPIAVGLLYAGIHTLSPWQAAFKGWLYGVGLFGSGASWVYVSIHDYGYTGIPLALFLTVLFVVSLALFFAIPFWLYRRFTSPGWAVLSFAGTWVLAEVLRTYLFTGFPWLLAGTPQVDSPLAPWAPIGGVYLLSLITALTGTLGVELLRRRWLAALPLAGMWLAPLVLPGQWTTASDETTQVSLLQGNLPQLMKWTEEGQQDAIDTYTNLTRQQPDNVDLVIWPETALPMLETDARPILERAKRDLPEQAALLTGILQRNSEGRFFNAIVGAGNVEGNYRKEHLVPFGEYLPLESVLRGAVAFFDLPTSFTTPGEPGQPPMQAAGLKIGSAICYEIVYADLVAKRARDADILLTLSNDTWFGESIGPLQHLQMARLRALENGRYVVRATSNGVTAIADPRGQITARAPQFKTASLTDDIHAMQGQTPFTRTGSWPTWLLATALVLPGLRFKKRNG